MRWRSRRIEKKWRVRAAQILAASCCLVYTTNRLHTHSHKATHHSLSHKHCNTARCQAFPLRRLSMHQQIECVRTHTELSAHCVLHTLQTQTSSRAPAWPDSSLGLCDTHGELDAAHARTWPKPFPAFWAGAFPLLPFLPCVCTCSHTAELIRAYKGRGQDFLLHTTVRMPHEHSPLLVAFYQ